MKFAAYPFVAAAALALIGATVPQTPAPMAAIASSELPPAPERDLVVQTCTSCHTSAQFSGQRMSRDEWKATVVKMIGYGADVPEDKEPLIVDYLARSFPTAKQGVIRPQAIAPTSDLVLRRTTLIGRATRRQGSPMTRRGVNR